jgi:hypothetical protein
MARTRVYRNGVLEAEGFPVADISDRLAEAGTVVWLDLCVPDQDDLAAVSEEFGLHPLAVEDAIHQHQRPKLDRYQTHLFLSTYAVGLDTASGELQTSEVAVFLNATRTAAGTVLASARAMARGAGHVWHRRVGPAGGGGLGRVQRRVVGTGADLFPEGRVVEPFQERVALENASHEQRQFGAHAEDHLARSVLS